MEDQMLAGEISVRVDDKQRYSAIITLVERAESFCRRFRPSVIKVISFFPAASFPFQTTFERHACTWILRLLERLRIVFHHPLMQPGTSYRLLALTYSSSALQVSSVLGVILSTYSFISLLCGTTQRKCYKDYGTITT